MQIQEFPKMLVREGQHCVVLDQADEIEKRADGWAMAGEADEADEAEKSSAHPRKKKAG